MANWHVRQRSGNGIEVAFHIAVPAGNNTGGISWANALVKSGLGGTTVLADGTGTDGGISASEKASLVAGNLLEVIATYQVQPGQSAAQVSAALTALWNDLS